MKNKSNLTRKTFRTKDAKGCEFKCKAYYNREEETAEYCYGSLSADTLEKLQKLVSEI